MFDNKEFKNNNFKSIFEGSYIESLFEKIYYSGKSIKNKSIFTDQVFHLYTDKKDEKKQIIFKPNYDVLVVTKNGKTYKGIWDYLPEYQGITIEFNNNITTYEHSFLNETIFALKLANSNKIDLYINEVRFKKLVNKVLNQASLKEYLDSLNSLAKNTSDVYLDTQEQLPNENDSSDDESQKENPFNKKIEQAYIFFILFFTIFILMMTLTWRN